MQWGHQGMPTRLQHMRHADTHSTRSPRDASPRSGDTQAASRSAPAALGSAMSAPYTICTWIGEVTAYVPPVQRQSGDTYTHTYMFMFILQIYACMHTYKYM